jgi:N-methylhydantoinase B
MTALANNARAKDEFDAIELEILWKRLIGIVDEAAAAFVRTCFSTLVRDANDFAVVLTDASGRALAQSSISLPGFIACAPAAVRHFLQKFPAATMHPGDVYITNDPWKATGHIHDVTTATPIFHRNKLVAFAAAVSHLPDIGGRLRSNSCREIYEEGLQIPLMKLVDAGQVNQGLVEIIRQNIRVPEQGLGDIWAQVAAGRMMVARLQGLLDTVDLDSLGTAIRARSETAMREAIRRLPDGTYRSVVEHDGVEDTVRIALALTVNGDRIDADYEGTSPQIARSLNTPQIFVRSYTAFGLKALLCPDVPNNDGSLAPLTTRAPLGCLLNPVFPAATGGRAAIGHLLPGAVFQALADVLPERVWAPGSPNSSITMSGEYRGKRYAGVSFITAGQGANARRDGYSALAFPANPGNTPVEVLESQMPIRVLRRGLRAGSGGTGRHNGGDGISFEYEILKDAPDVIASFLMTKMKSAPQGAEGGGPGKACRLLVNGEAIDPTEPRILRAGDRVVVETAGGGAYGKA